MGFSLHRLRGGSGWGLAIEFGSLTIDRHEPFRVLEWLEPVLLVEAVGVAGRENRDTQSLELRMRDHRLDQPLPYPTAASRFADEDIADPGEGGAVGHDPGEPDQLAVLEGTKAQAVVDRTVEDGPRNAAAPVGLAR